MFSQDAYASGEMSDLEYDCDQEISTLQTKLKAAEQQTSLLEEKLKIKKNRKIKTQGYGIAQNMHEQYFAAYMTYKNYFTMHACGCAAFADREYQESLKNGTTQGLVQSVHNRPVPCDQEVSTDHSQELPVSIYNS